MNIYNVGGFVVIVNFRPNEVLLARKQVHLIIIKLFLQYDPFPFICICIPPEIKLFVKEWLGLDFEIHNHLHIYLFTCIRK